MRRRIRSAILRERFDKAWAVLPLSEQKRLRPFIRYVDEVDVVEGTFIYGRPGPGKGIEIIVGPLEGPSTGFTALMTLNSRDVADIILPSNPLASCDEGATLLIILHELAHAAYYLDNSQEAIDQSEYRTEMYAWAQAVAWAYRSTLSDELSAEIAIYGRRAMLEELVHSLG